MEHSPVYGLDEARADLQRTRALIDNFSAQFGPDVLEVVLEKAPQQLGELQRSIPELDLTTPELGSDAQRPGG